MTCRACRDTGLRWIRYGGREIEDLCLRCVQASEAEWWVRRADKEPGKRRSEAA